MSDRKLLGMASVAGVSLTFGAAACEGSRCLSHSRSTLAADVVEHDKTARRGTVYLFTRPLEDMPDEKRIERQHWAIVCKFDDDSWRTAEGTQGDDCNIHAHYTKQSPREKGEYRNLGEIKSLSPSQLRSYAADVSINGQPYLLSLNNCQEWAKELAAKLGPYIRQSIDRVNTLREENPVMAYSVGSGIASLNSYKRLSPSSSGRS